MGIEWWCAWFASKDEAKKWLNDMNKEHGSLADYENSMHTKEPTTTEKAASEKLRKSNTANGVKLWNILYWEETSDEEEISDEEYVAHSEKVLPVLFPKFLSTMNDTQE